MGLDSNIICYSNTGGRRNDQVWPAVQLVQVDDSVGQREVGVSYAAVELAGRAHMQVRQLGNQQRGLQKNGIYWLWRLQ